MIEDILAFGEKKISFKISKFQLYDRSLTLNDLDDLDELSV